MHVLILASRAMAMQRMHHLLLLSLLILLVLAPKSTSQPHPDCPKECGALSIPYPFGTREGCYLDPSFLINCTQTSNSTTPTPFLQRSNRIVLSIALEDGELRISNPIAYDCYNQNKTFVNRTLSALNLTYFYVSSSKNKFTVVGCDTLGLVVDWDRQEKNYTIGCVSLCNSLDDIAATRSCSGTGCCQISIPHGIYTISFGSFGAVSNHSTVLDFNPCGYAFVVEEEAYKFSSADLISFQNKTVPLVLDWAVGNQTCEEAQNNRTSFACKAEHSECYNSTNGAGYRCNCSHGFQGNPYLIDGCHDVNECEESNDCVEGACHNLIGSYQCTCRKGFEGDGKSSGTGCSRVSRKYIILVTALSVSVSLLALLVGGFYAYWALKKRKLIQLREKYFQQNGGILLQQRIARHNGSTETAKIFTSEELKKATNNFDENRIIGRGGHGIVYRGELPNNRVVAIKKSKISDQTQIEQFINEVIVLSQINHRNVVKLLGCCLETEVPLLVYEFITNGTLSDHLHGDVQSQPSQLAWKARLRIAKETAGALAYLHSAADPPIIHRDVKSTNILLDSDLTAKVSDFGASRLVPLNQSQLTTLVQGTLGYLDPEYLHTSQLTEKSDVYSFGVLLAELLTSRKALCFDRREGDQTLSVYFVSAIKEGRLLQIIDNCINDQANVEQVREVANIAKRCLSVKGDDRPDMREVAMELEGLRIIERQPWGGTEASSEETDYLLKAVSPPYNIVDTEHGIGGSGSISGVDSINQISISLNGGR